MTAPKSEEKGKRVLTGLFFDKKYEKILSKKGAAVPPNKTYFIENTDQLREIVAPVRNQIRLAIEMLGECSVSELGERLGRSPESLYYHIRKLESVGLMLQTGTREVRGREEALYSMCAPRVRMNTTIRKPGFIQTLLRGTRTLLRYAERCYAHAMQDPQTKMTKSFRECRVIQMTARLGRRQVKELDRRLLELEDFLESSDDPAETQRYVVTISLSPTQHDEAE